MRGSLSHARDPRGHLSPLCIHDRLTEDVPGWARCIGQSLLAEKFTRREGVGILQFTALGDDCQRRETPAFLGMR